MVIKNLVGLICLLALVACKDNGESNKARQEISTIEGYKLSPIADSLFTEYVKTFPSQSAYAIFIDKKTEGGYEYVLTIAPFAKAINNLNESGAANYFYTADSVPVFLYTGLEDFIESDSREFANARKRPDDVPGDGEFKHYDAIKRKVDFTKSWSYVHLDTVNYVVKGNDYPFINTTIRPTLEFSPPDSI